MWLGFARSLFLTAKNMMTIALGVTVRVCCMMITMMMMTMMMMGMTRDDEDTGSGGE